MSDLIHALVTIVTTLFGYGAVAALLRNKVDVVTYQAKVKELHDLRNADREELVALRAEVRILREYHRAELTGAVSIPKGEKP